MTQHSPGKTEEIDVSRVDSLLTQLREQTRHDPPPALRERLEQLGGQRVQVSPASFVSRLWGVGWKRRVAFSVAAAMGCLLLTALLIDVLPYRQNSRVKTNRASVSLHTNRPTPDANTQSLPQSSAGGRVTDSAPMAVRVFRSKEATLVIPLPYSDHAVATGTSSAIRVSVSQSELLALGVPVTPAAHDQRFVAELILGADGLPRALNVPLPLIHAGGVQE